MGFIRGKWRQILKDRFVRGLLAGFIGGLPTIVFNHSAFHLNLSTLRFLDFMAIIIYGHKPKIIWDSIFAGFATFGQVSVMGMLFAYLILAIKSENYLIKGFVYGGFMWFLFYTAASLFKVHPLANIPLKTVISNLIGSSIWGISMAYTLCWLDKRVD